MTANRIVDSLSSFIPSICKRYLAQDFDSENFTEPPLGQEFHTTVLFADVSGFTKLSEMLSKKGIVGSEELGFYLNRYLERLIKVIAKSGGDVFKFAGDAMLVLWPPDWDGAEPTQEEMALQVHRVAQCSLEIQKELHEAELAENVNLSVKLGIGVGRAMVIHVGGVYKRLEYLAVGPPLVQAFESEHACSAGDTVVSKEGWELIKDHFTGEKLEDGNVKLLNSSKQVKVISINARKTEIGNEEQLMSRMTRYVPAAIMPFMEIDNSMWAGELRQITVLFINLGIKLGKISEVSPDLLHRVQQIIAGVQTAVYMYEGSLNKFLVDDKGSTLISVFGLPPLAHNNDPARAILCSLKLQQVMSAIGIQTSIGVTSGVAFCGLVGSKSRREYSVLGDIVNLSARLMQNANGGVLCDKATFFAAQNEKRLSFENLEEIKVKGKSEMIQVYSPSYIAYNVKIQKAQRVPFSVGRNSQIETLQEALDLVVTTAKSQVVLVEGEFGAGKTHVLRRFTQLVGSTTRVVWGAADAFATDKPHFVWKQVCAHLLQIFASDLSPSERQQWFFDLVKAQAPDLLEHISVVNNLLNFGFDTKSALPSSNERAVIRTAVADFARLPDKFLSVILNAEEKKIFLNASRDIFSESESAILKIVMKIRSYIEVDFCILYLHAVADESPIVIILDECHHMIDSDWHLTGKLAQLLSSERMKNILLVVSTRPLLDVKYKPKFAPVPKDYDEIRTSCSFKIYLDYLSQADTEQLLFLSLSVSDVETEIVRVVHERTGGCPLFIIKFIEVLRSTKVIEVVNNSCRFFDCVLEQLYWESDLPCPYGVARITAGHIDKLTTPEIILLKVASVLCYASNSLTFDYETLVASHPIREYKTSLNADIIKLIKANFFQCPSIEEDDDADVIMSNFRFNFTYGFISDVLYQILLFQQRRIIHRLAEAHLVKELEANGPTDLCNQEIVARHHDFGLDTYDGTQKTKIVQPKGFWQKLFGCINYPTESTRISVDKTAVDCKRNSMAVPRRLTHGQNRELSVLFINQHHSAVKKSPRAAKRVSEVEIGLKESALTNLLTPSFASTSTAKNILTLPSFIPDPKCTDEAYAAAAAAAAILKKLSLQYASNSDQAEIAHAINSLEHFCATKSIF